MNHRSWLTVAIILLFIAPSGASAADIAFFPVETANLLANDAVAVGEALALSYATTSSQAVLRPNQSAAALAESTSYESAAQRLGVREFVRTMAVATGRRIGIVATRMRSDGQVVFQTRLIAQSADDLLSTCDRLAKSLYMRQSDELILAAQHGRILGVRPVRLYGVKIGMHLPFARKARYGAGIGASFDLRLELEHYFLEFGAGVIIPTDSENRYEYASRSDEMKPASNRGYTGSVQVEIGASRYLTRGELGIYIGAGVLPRIQFREDAGAMALYGQLGMSVPRSSSIRFSLDLRLAQVVTPLHLENGREVFPSEPTLHAGVGW